MIACSSGITGVGAPPSPAPLPPCTLHALVYAHLLDRSGVGAGATQGEAGGDAQGGPEGSSTAAVQAEGGSTMAGSDTHQQRLLAFARQQLGVAAEGVEKDQLAPTARCAR